MIACSSEVRLFYAKTRVWSTALLESQRELLRARTLVFVLFSRDDIGPQSLDLLWLQRASPRRHTVFAMRDGIHETVVLIAGKEAEIECPFWIGHMRAVAGGAILRKQRGARADLLGRKFMWLRFLGGGRSAGNGQCQNHGGLWRKSVGYLEIHSTAGRQRRHFISAKVHTEPPCGTFLSASRAAFQYCPPTPDKMVTYCSPLCVKVMGCALRPDPV